jgi:hypothetical protein
MGAYWSGNRRHFSEITVATFLGVPSPLPWQLNIDSKKETKLQSVSNIFVLANAASDQSRHKDVWNALYYAPARTHGKTKQKECIHCV